MSIGRFPRSGIGMQLALSIGALLAIFSVAGLLILTSTVTLYRISGITEDAASALTQVGNLNLFGVHQKNIANDFLVTGRELDRKTYADARKNFETAMVETRKIFQARDPSLLPALKAYGDVHDEWQASIGDKEFELGAGLAGLQAGRALLESPLAGALNVRSRAAGAGVIKATQDWSDHWNKAHHAQLDYLRLIVLCAILGGGLLATVIGWVMTRAIASPLSAMAGAMRSLAAGDNTVVIPAKDRKDEIGDMAGAVQFFKDAAVEKIGLEQAAASARRTADEERARNEAAGAEAVQRQTHVVRSLATGLEKLSSGDLKFRLNDRFAADYEQLRSDFNAAMDTLQEVMTSISTATSAMRSGAGEISSASDDLSRRTEQQAASLEEAAAALDEITATVRKTAEGSAHARQVVGAAAKDAERSGVIVREAITAMNDIDESSRQIGQIIGVIDEIAFQTNLLALNAGVEAARAGDAGRGFAVVASEVRALAQRSAGAAKEIKTLIAASAQKVDTGVSLVGQTGAVLEQIVAQVKEINGIVTDIAASAQEQATGLQEVNTAVNQMDQVTQQNAAMVEQSTAASHHLAQESDELTRLVGRFQVGEQPAPATAYTPPARRSKPAPVAAMKTTGRGGAALRSEPAQEDWREF
jgi:methyl-accepting chemotaxis protein